MTRVIYFGQSLAIFDWLLLRRDIQLVGVYVSRLSPASRPQWLTRSVVSSIPLIELSEERIQLSELEQTLEDQLDLGICAHFEIIPSEVITKFRLGIINIHPAPLPDFPGRYPLIALCLSEERRAGVSLHWISEHVDRGDLIAVQELPRHPLEGPLALERRAEQFACQLLGEHWRGIIGGYAPRQPQLDHAERPLRTTQKMSRVIPSLFEINSLKQLIKSAIAYAPYGGLACALYVGDQKINLRIKGLDLANLLECSQRGQGDQSSISSDEQRVMTFSSWCFQQPHSGDHTFRAILEPSWGLVLHHEAQLYRCKFQCTLAVESLEDMGDQTSLRDLLKLLEPYKANSELLTIHPCDQVFLLP